MQVSFPQKSTFDTVTANKIYCPDIDTLGASISMRIAGTERAQLSASALYVFANLRIAATKEIRDGENNVIIASDDAGHIDQFGDPSAILQVAVTAAQAYTGYTTGAVSIDTDGTIDFDASGQAQFGVTLPTKLAGIPLEITAVIVSYYTAHNDAYITATYARVYDIPYTTYASVISDAADKGNGSTGVASYTETVTTDHNLETMPIFRLTIDCVAVAGIVKLRGFVVLLKRHD